MSKDPPYSAKKDKAMLAWLHSDPMLGAPDVVHSVGWGAIEPYHAKKHWAYIQERLATLAKNNKKGDPPCT